MKFLFALLIVIAVKCNAIAQFPPNMIGANEDSVKLFMTKIGATLNSRTYSNTGYPLLSYGFSRNLTTLKNIQGNSIFGAFFLFGIKEMCSECCYLYADENELQPIVEALNGNPDFVKKINEFAWQSRSYSYDIYIKFSPNHLGFSCTYTFKGKANQ